MRANATERVVVLMTPKQKADVTKRATDEQLSVGDFMRRQALGDDELLTALLNELKGSAAYAKEALDRTLARLADFEQRHADIEMKARQKAQAEFSDIDPDALGRFFFSGDNAANDGAR
jgi:hypothetical protein